MRVGTAEQSLEPAAHSDFVPRGKASTFVRAGVLVVMVVLLFGGGLAAAEPASIAARETLPVSLPAQADTNARPLPVSLSISNLLEIRQPLRSDAEIADALIAEAVQRGPRPDLEPLNPFRKRKADLFRAERPLEIGDQEMLVRLRLRAKRREAMSLELRF